MSRADILIEAFAVGLGVVALAVLAVLIWTEGEAGHD